MKSKASTCYFNDSFLEGEVTFSAISTCRSYVRFADQGPRSLPLILLDLTETLIY